jgi:release factor glutamine methyltransferase
MNIDLRTALNQATDRLAGAGVEAARLDAELLMAHALDLSREELYLAPDRRLGAGEAEAFDALVLRRAAREPVARILGAREFWSLDFALNAATLVPRPDSETLVAAVLQEIGEVADGDLRLLDLGTGSGCLLLALLSELPRASGIGVDCDDAALAAADNARQLGLQERAEFRRGDWFAALDAGDKAQRFDVIVSNPPYIESDAIAGLAPEVADYEPRRALDGGADGLDAYRKITAGAPEFLVPGGLLLLELGAGQDGAVSRILRDRGFSIGAVYDDLAGIPRVISAVFSMNSGNE